MNGSAAPRTPVRLRVGQIEYCFDFTTAVALELFDAIRQRGPDPNHTSPAAPALPGNSIDLQKHWPHAEDFGRVFVVDDDGIIYLRKLPTTEPREAHAILLLLYAYLIQRGDRIVRAGHLVEGGKRSGLCFDDRVKPFLNAFIPSHLTWIGEKHASQYALTDAGIELAQQLYENSLV
jgi:hypothetical protein